MGRNEGASEPHGRAAGIDLSSTPIDVVVVDERRRIVKAATCGHDGSAIWLSAARAAGS
jgi:hypothetical protein